MPIARIEDELGYPYSCYIFISITQITATSNFIKRARNPLSIEHSTTTKTIGHNGRRNKIYIIVKEPKC